MSECKHGIPLYNPCPECVGIIDCPPESGSHHSPGCSTADIPDVLYDGFAVYSELDEKAKRRTGAENVSDVLDAVVRLLKKQVP